MDTRRKCIIASYMIFLVVIIPALESVIAFAEDPQIPTRTKVSEIEIYPPDTNLLTSNAVPETIAGNDIIMDPGKFIERLNDCSGLFAAGESGCCINPNDTKEHNCKLAGDDVSEEGTYLAKIKYGYKLPRKNAVTPEDKDDIRTSVLFTAHSVDWDANKEQCIKKMGSNEPEVNWYESANAGNNCCGDDPVEKYNPNTKNNENDCGLLKQGTVNQITTDTLCLNHEDNPKPGSKAGEWQWHDAEDEINSVKYNSCADFEALAKKQDDGSFKWIACGDASASSAYNEEEFRYSIYPTFNNKPIKKEILVYLPVMSDGYIAEQFAGVFKLLGDHGFKVSILDRLITGTTLKPELLDKASQVWVLNAERQDYTLLTAEPNNEIDALKKYRDTGGSLLLASGTYYDEPYVSFSPPSYNQRSDISRTFFSSAGTMIAAGAAIGAAIGVWFFGVGAIIGAAIGALIGLVIAVITTVVSLIKGVNKAINKFFRKVFGKRKKRPKPHTYYIPHHYISIVNQISKDLNLGIEFNKKNVELADNEATAPSSFGDAAAHPAWNNVRDGIYMNSQAATLKKLKEDDFNVKIIGQQETTEGTANFLAAREDELGKVLFDTDLVKYMFAIGDEPKVGDTDTFILNLANWLEDRSRGPFKINSSYPTITLPLTAQNKKFKAPAEEERGEGTERGEYVLESSNPNVELKFRTTAGEEKDSVTSADNDVDIIAKLRPFLAGSAFNGERFPTTSIAITPEGRDAADPTVPIHKVLCKINHGIGSIVECCGARNKPCFTHSDNSMLAQKRFGDSASLYLKNPDFDLFDSNNKASIYYWHNSTMAQAELKRPRRKIKSEIKVESINTGGRDAYAANNVLYMNYSGGKANGYSGIYAYSDVFQVPPTSDTSDGKIDVSFYYKTLLSKKNSAMVKAQIFWYADNNNAAVDINNPPSSPLPTLLGREVTDNSEWNKFSIKVGKPADYNYARIVLSVEQYDKGGTGAAYFDKFTIGKRYYCVHGLSGLEDDTLWDNNLDGSNKQSCESAGDKEFGKSFAWTGAQCCGDKAGEFYNDIYGKEAGCWNSTKVTNGSLVSDDNRVLNYNGKFYSCNINAGDELFINVKNTDYTAPTPLIAATDTDENVGLCKTFSSLNNVGIAQGYYCSPNAANGQSIWKNDAVKDTKVSEAARIAYNRTKLSEAAQGMFALLRKECCPQKTCWNGTDCMHDQTTMPWEEPTYNFRCAENETGSVDWRVPVKKITWDGMQEGYCPTESYCLVPDGSNPPNPQGLKCIKSEQFVGNHYCDDGKWSTRTRLVAEALLNYTLDNSPDEFVLYCDEFKNVLPDIKSTPEYIGDQQATAEAFLAKAGANHVCILQTKDGKKLFGAAADIPIDAELNFGASVRQIQQNPSTKYKFISLFSPNAEVCRDAILDDGKFTMCANSNDASLNKNLWVNNKTKLVIYSRQDISNFKGKPAALKILEFLVNPLQATISFIRNILRPKIIVANINLDIIKQPKDFTRFYFAKYKKDNKDLILRAVIETQRNKDSLLAEYEGFKADVCQRAIEAYDDKRINKNINDPLAVTDDIQCYPAINATGADAAASGKKLIYRVVMQKDSREGIPIKFWQDLVAKIRPEHYASAAGSQADSDLAEPTAEILLPAASYKVSELMQDGLRLTSGKNSQPVSYYWNLDTHESYAGIFGSAGELQYNRTFMLADLYSNPKRVSGDYNISLISLRDGIFNFTSKKVNFESILGVGNRPGCRKKLGDANNDNAVNLADYALLRQIAKSCIESYNRPLTQGAVVSGNSYDLMNETCVCVDVDQNENLEYGSPATAYDADPQTDPSKQDENEFVEICGKTCDSDQDGFIDMQNIDNCVGISNHEQKDTDKERDNLKNADQIDLGAGITARLLKTERSIGDACDNCTDTDHDGYGNQGFDISGCELSQTKYDNCPDNKFNPLQQDLDIDGLGDACDPDKDGDGKNNEDDYSLQHQPQPDCSEENSRSCTIFQKFNAASGCCEPRNLFAQTDAEIKNSCMPNEIAVLCLSAESNAHGASIVPTLATVANPPTPCPAGYKPICYPKAPDSGLSSTTCGIENSTAAFNLSGTTNAHASHASHGSQGISIISIEEGYNIPICVQSEYGNLTCTYAEKCMANEFCLVTLSPGNNNLHLAACDSSEDSKAYSQKVCCTLGNQMRKTCLTRTNQDVPCTRKCGNGIMEANPENDEGVNEECDGRDLGGKTLCSEYDANYVSGNLKCAPGCIYDTSGCFDKEQFDKAQALPTSPKCGNGVVDRQFGEECDGRDLQGKTFCTDLNTPTRKIYETGKLSCIPKGEPNACKYSTRNCHGSCGNGRIDSASDEQCDPTVNPILDYTCYNYSAIAPLRRTFGLITRCSATCEYDTANCKPVISEKDSGRRCKADGILQWWNGEQCDGNLLSSTTCEEQGYGAGSLVCNSACQYDFAGCGLSLGNTCGDGIVQLHEDCDKGTGSGPVFRTDKEIPIKEKRQVQAKNPDGSLKTKPDGTAEMIDEWVVIGTQKVPETCVQHDYGTGSLRCNDDCTINLEGCDDSSLLCGNRIIDSAEDCDPSAAPMFIKDASCVTLGLGFTSTDTAKLGCTSRCEYDPTKCT